MSTPKLADFWPWENYPTAELIIQNELVYITAFLYINWKIFMLNCIKIFKQFSV